MNESHHWLTLYPVSVTSWTHHMLFYQQHNSVFAPLEMCFLYWVRCSFKGVNTKVWLTSFALNTSKNFQVMFTGFKCALKCVGLLLFLPDDWSPVMFNLSSPFVIELYFWEIRSMVWNMGTWHDFLKIVLHSQISIVPLVCCWIFTIT